MDPCASHSSLSAILSIATALLPATTAQLKMATEDLTVCHMRCYHSTCHVIIKSGNYGIVLKNNGSELIIFEEFASVYTVLFYRSLRFPI